MTDMLRPSSNSGLRMNNRDHNHNLCLLRVDLSAWKWLHLCAKTECDTMKHRTISFSRKRKELLISRLKVSRSRPETGNSQYVNHAVLQTVRRRSRLAWSENWRPLGAESAFIKWTWWTPVMTMVMMRAPWTTTMVNIRIYQGQTRNSQVNQTDGR